MKKVLLVLLVLAVAAAGYFFWKKQEIAPGARELVPANTVAFIEAPDLQRSHQRWTKTALFQILHEPQVQAFLERPRTKVPQQGEVKTHVDHIRRIHPRDAFAALTSMNGSQFLAGFRFAGAKEDVDSLSGEIKAQFHKMWPAAKTDLVSHPAGNIETYTVNNFTVSVVTTKNWWLVSNNMDLLKSALDRVTGKVHGKAGTLAESDAFKKATAKLPVDPEIVFYTQAQEWMDRLLTLMKATGQEPDSATLAKIKAIHSIAGTTRFEGELVRDTFFCVRTGTKSEPTMERHSMALTNAESLALYTAALNFEQKIHLPNPALDQTGVVQWLENLRVALEQAGVTTDDLIASMGKEAGAVMDWPKDSPQPSLLIGIDIQDRAKAQKFVDVFTSGVAGMPPWTKQTQGANDFYVLSSTGVAFLTPALALSDKFLVLGLSLPAVQDGLKRLATPGAKLDSASAFQASSKTVGAPTKSFAYLDAKGFFERVYGTARPLVMMYGAFAPGVGTYVDLNKLPEIDTIARHLSPILASQSTSPDGDLSESVGPVTFTQAAIVGGISAGVAIPLAMKNHLIPTPGPAKHAPAIAAPVPVVPPSVTPVPAESASPDPASTP